jgi:hypothetical protein
VPQPFLSDEWFEEVRAIRDRHARPDDVPSVTVNVTITDVPGRSGPLQVHVDTTSGAMLFELGHLSVAEVSITTDHTTARDLLMSRDQNAAMTAFMSGKIRIQGDLAKLLAWQTNRSIDTERAAQVAAELVAATA